MEHRTEREGESMSAYLEKEFERMTKSKIEFFPSSGPVHEWTAHLHPAVEIICFVKGEHIVTVDEEMVLTAKPGDMVIFPANTVHVLAKKNNEPTLHYALKLHPDLLFSAFVDVPRTYIMRFFDRSALTHVYYDAESIPECVRQQWKTMIGLLQGAKGIRDVERLALRDELLYSDIRAEAIRLLILLIRHLPPPAEEGTSQMLGHHVVRRIFDGITYIEQNYASPITPEDCAAHLCMSYSHFAKQFRAVTGRTFKQYLTYIRISHAESELLTTNDSVTEIAMRAGFNNVSHFIATYRAVRGKTPLETRRARSEEISE
ncbi:MAG: AraC family transcriptional regulator [Clostridia bacterium]|nr:AraC family transcriptional regulator [Clostridia bacterium]